MCLILNAEYSQAHQIVKKRLLNNLGYKDYHRDMGMHVCMSGRPLLVDVSPGSASVSTRIYPPSILDAEPLLSTSRSGRCRARMHGTPTACCSDKV